MKLLLIERKMNWTFDQLKSYLSTMKSFIKKCRIFRKKVRCYFSDFDLDSKQAYAFMELCFRLISKFLVCLKCCSENLFLFDRIQRFWFKISFFTFENHVNINMQFYCTNLRLWSDQFNFEYSWLPWIAILVILWNCNNLSSEFWWIINSFIYYVMGNPRRL